jgi:hypothetical protein
VAQHWWHARGTVLIRPTHPPPDIARPCLGFGETARLDILSNIFDAEWEQQSCGEQAWKHQMPE